MKVLTAVKQDFSDSRHHGGGVMMRGGFDVEEVEVTVEQYARRLVQEVSMHVAYRKWLPMEMLNIGQDMRFYLFCHRDMSISLVRVNLHEEFPLTGNDWWRKEVIPWIEKNYEDDPLEDVILLKSCVKHGEPL